jgi:YD repeat-containing protein
MKTFRIALFFGIFITARADVVNYGYDDAGRLARVDYPSGASILYTYDNAGNLLSRTVNKPSGNQARPARSESTGAQPRRSRKSTDSKRKRGFDATPSR